MKDNEKNENHFTLRQKRETEFYNKQVSFAGAISSVCAYRVWAKKTRLHDPYWQFYKLVAHKCIDKNKKLLDFGCGQGVNSILYADLGYDVHGFDVSLASIETANKLAREYNCSDRIKFSVGLAESINYPSEYFDIIVGVNILHHVDVVKSIREMYRVLKKGGDAIFLELLWAPLIDTLRYTKVGLRFVPRGPYMTADEHSLTAKDILSIKGYFPEMRIRKFELLARFRQWIGYGEFLYKLDQLLFMLLPFLRYYGDVGILTMRKNQLDI